MENKLTAKELLEKLEKTDQGFVINNEVGLTREVKKLIDRTDWDNIALQNKITHLFDIQVDNLDPSWYNAHLTALNDNKYFTRMTPTNARFRFFKRLLNRVMRISGRYQEQFNQILIGLLNNIVEKVSESNSICASENSKINQLNTRMENIIIKQKNIESKIEDLNTKLYNIDKLITALDGNMKTDHQVLVGLRDELFAEVKTSISLMISDSNNKEQKK